MLHPKKNSKTYVFYKVFSEVPNLDIVNKKKDIVNPPTNILKVCFKEITNNNKNKLD